MIEDQANLMMYGRLLWGCQKGAYGWKIILMPVMVGGQRQLLLITNGQQLFERNTLSR